VVATVQALIRKLTRAEVQKRLAADPLGLTCAVTEYGGGLLLLRSEGTEADIAARAELVQKVAELDTQEIVRELDEMRRKPRR